MARLKENRVVVGLLTKKSILLKIFWLLLGVTISRQYVTAIRLLHNFIVNHSFYFKDGFGCVYFTAAEFLFHHFTRATKNCTQEICWSNALALSSVCKEK